MDKPIIDYSFNRDEICSLQPQVCQQITAQLEDGHVIYLPQVPFSLSDVETEFLTPNIINKKAKNISYNIHHDRLSGAHLPPQHLTRLRNFMRRYAEFAQELVHQLFPSYHQALQMGRTSYRPVEIKNRSSSYRKDDTRLHVDAFPSMPVQGRRIFRVFSNVNPYHQARVWNLGEPFATVADRFLPSITKPKAISAALLKACKITKGWRTPYDHYMLHIHDAMKGDDNYQQTVNKIEIPFPPATTWCVFTDQASHAALTGQYLLEQTFYLPVSAMNDETKTPLRVLETKLGYRLVR